MTSAVLVIEAARFASASGDVAFVATPSRVPLGHGLTVGRKALPGQVVLDHPNVSNRHAAFELAERTVALRDLGGTNGTYVNGARLRGARVLSPGDRIDIGPFTSAMSSCRRGASATMCGAGSPAPRRSVARTPPACASVRPSWLVCIVGADGTGKSILMNILPVDPLPSEGTVLPNQVDLHANFEALT